MSQNLSLWPVARFSLTPLCASGSLPRGRRINTKSRILSELVSCSQAYSVRTSMTVFSSPCNALLIEACYTDEYKVIHEESLLIVRERRTGMKVLLLQKGNLLPSSLYLTKRNSKAS